MGPEGHLAPRKSAEPWGLRSRWARLLLSEVLGCGAGDALVHQWAHVSCRWGWLRAGGSQQLWCQDCRLAAGGL